MQCTSISRVRTILVVIIALILHDHLAYTRLASDYMQLVLTTAAKLLFLPCFYVHLWETGGKAFIIISSLLLMDYRKVKLECMGVGSHS